MKNTIINNDTTIQVHFNDIDNPTKATYALDTENGLVVLQDDNCDMNYLLEVREISGFSGEPDIENEVQYSGHEHVYAHYYEVRNGDFPNPFTDDSLNHPNK